MRTKFQYYFVEEKHIYSASSIRHAIKKNFPIREGKISGLSKIIINNITITPDNEDFNLENLIPDIQEEFQIKIVEEDKYSTSAVVPTTHFISTDNGYICKKIEY